ncbi:hypothetical protein POTOM_055647 [Populus tomentosa]|uniref:DUF1262 family protein n=1 Tax=Populus tomentosa TaxID=118781 RepID=A0A8X7Y0G0_POPTO|nr:hypothetical protein POTOM_055647 [Populus tomentosa]
MYVTRPLSMYKRNPSALSSVPPEGSNSGILIIQDEEVDLTCCFCCSKIDFVKDLPFPQNKNLTPLSSNRYYVIERQGKHKGEAHTNAKEEDETTCCFGFCRHNPDKEPQSFDPKDVYEQFEICKSKRFGYVSKSVAPDGIPPYFLRRKGWTVSTSTARDFELKEAAGLDRNLRARLPDFHPPLSQRSSAAVVVGNWYCPFMFIKEGKLKDQMSISSEGNSVIVDAAVQRETVAVAGREVAPDKRNAVDGVMWFRSSRDVGGEASVGLSLEIVGGMKWEQERAGWLGGGGSDVTVKRVEEFGGVGGWKKFGCYVLVKRFVLRRMDGSLVLTYDFKHTHQVRSKWE